MSIPTITAGRIYEGQSRGVDGESNNLTMDTFPYSALVEDLHARRAGRRFRSDRDRHDHRRQDPQRRDRRRPDRAREGLRRAAGPRGDDAVRDGRGGGLGDRHRFDRPHHACHPGRHLRPHRQSRLGRATRSSATPRPRAARTLPTSSSTGRRATASRSRSAAAAATSCRRAPPIRKTRARWAAAPTAAT